MALSTLRSSRDLYDLIQSLNTEEKAYTKNYIKASYKGDAKEMLWVLDGYSAIKNLAEMRNSKMAFKDAVKAMRKKVAARLKTKNEKSALNKIAKLEVRLYDKILYALDGYQQEHNAYFMLRRDINHAGMLIRKRLYSQAKRLMDKTEPKIMKNGNAPMYLEFLLWKHHIVRYYEPEKKSKGWEDIIMQELNLTLEYMNDRYYAYWLTKVLDIAHIGNPLNIVSIPSDFLTFLNRFCEEAKFYEKVVSKVAVKSNSPSTNIELPDIPNFLNEDGAISLDAQTYCQNALSIFYDIQYNMGNKKALAQKLYHDEKSVSMYEGKENKWYRLYSPENYSIMLNANGNTLLKMGRYAQFKKLVEKYSVLRKEIKKENQVQSVYVLTEIANNEFELILRYIKCTGDVNTYKDKLTDFFVFFDQYKEQIEHVYKISFQHFLAFWYAYNDDFSSALGQISDVLQKRWEPDDKYRMDVQYEAVILNLMLELDSIQAEGKYVHRYADVLIKNARNFLGELGKYGLFEKLLLHEFRGLLKATESEIQAKLILFLNKLKLAEPQPAIIENLNLISWLESKIQGKPWNKVIMEKCGLRSPAGMGDEG